MNSLLFELEIKKLLKYSWSAFFSRYGRFFSAQLKAIPLILNKKNVLIKAPPGTGKTEAVIAPLIENLKKERWSNLSILYIVPTRALANDIIKRLEPPLEQLEIKIKRKTGDFPYEFKNSSDCSILVITPESLDSLLCKSARVISKLKAIVLDELHLLDNTARGDQLRILLNRIKSLSPSNQHIQYCALSATFENPLQQALRYFNSPCIVEEINKKKIYYEIFYEDWDKILKFFIKNNFKKIIIFCNTRAEAEILATKVNIPPFKNKIYVHHGSLNRNERLRVEEIINESKVAICIATMTLEFGIDIGDIDAIGLYRPPLSISSLLQRIGRGCRRRNDANIAFGICVDDLDYAIFSSLFKLVNEGSTDNIAYFPKYSVAIQQIFSLLKEKHFAGLFFGQLKNILMPFIPSENFLKEILLFLKEQDFIEMKNQIIYPTEKLINIANLPYIHSNIGFSKEKYIELRNIEDEKVIGKISIQDFIPGESFLFGGSKWKLLDIKGETAYVTGSIEKTEKVKRFLSCGVPLLSFALAQSVKKFYYPNYPESSFILTNTGKELLLFHFMGKLYGEILAKSYSLKYKLKIKDTKGLAFLIPKDKLFPLPLEEKDILKAINKHYQSLSKLLNMGKFFNYLPKELQKLNVYQSIDIAFLKEYLKKVRFET